MSRKVLIGITLICLISAFSLALVGQEIEKVKAYRNINFGESESTVKGKVRNNPEMEFVPPDGPYAWKAKVVIVETHYEVLFGFKKNQLRTLNFLGPSYPESSFGRVKTYRDTLVKVISSKYGDPSKTQKLELNDIGPFWLFPTWSHVWKAKATGQNKVIKISISKYGGGISPFLKIKYSSTNETTGEEAESEAEDF